MQVNFEFKDHRGEHTYYYDYPSVPRVGDDVRIPRTGDVYGVIKVIWDDGLPTCKLKLRRNTC